MTQNQKRFFIESKWKMDMYHVKESFWFSREQKKFSEHDTEPKKVIY